MSSQIENSLLKFSENYSKQITHMTKSLEHFKPGDPINPI